MENKNNNYEIEITYSNNLNSPENQDYYERMKNRIIYINEDIDDYIVDYSLLIMKWNQEDVNVKNPKPIKIIIHSNGGDVESVLNLIDVISVSKTPVYTIGMGKCYSSGGLLLMAGHKKFIFNNTTFLLHDGYAGTSNATGKAIDNFHFIQKQEVKIRQYVIEHSTISLELYNEKYREDWYMFSDDIIKYKIADKIIDDISEIF